MLPLNEEGVDKMAILYLDGPTHQHTRQDLLDQECQHEYLKQVCCVVYNPL